MISIEIITDEKQFEELKPEWEDLRVASNSKNIFLTFDWLYTWQQHFKRQFPMRLILARDEGKLVGALPLVVEKKFGFRRLRFMSFGMADYEDFLLRGDFNQRLNTLSALYSWLNKLEGWDSIRIQGILESSMNYPVLLKLVGNMGSPHFQLSAHKQVVSRIDLSGTYESFLSRLRAKFITDTNRRLKLLKKAATVRLEMLHDNHHDSEWIDSNLKAHMMLEMRRKNSTGTRSLFKDSQNQLFFKSVAKKFAARSSLDLSVLKADGNVCASHLGFRHKGTFGYYSPTFDESYSRYSPARLLLFDLIKESFNSELTQFDFMLGEHDYKRDFVPREEMIYYMTIYHPSWKGHLCRFIFEELNLAMKKFLSKPW